MKPYNSLNIICFKINMWLLSYICSECVKEPINVSTCNEDLAIIYHTQCTTVIFACIAQK